LPELKTSNKDKAKVAINAITTYANWLKDLDNPMPRSFRLGKICIKKIRSGHPVELQSTQYLKALNHKKELHKKMFVLADKLCEKYLKSESKPSDSLALIKLVIDKISLQHTTPKSAIEKQIPELAEFVKQKDLLNIDPQSLWWSGNPIIWRSCRCFHLGAGTIR
jgi:hypothetical protein